jgi:hypothetical protein
MIVIACLALLVLLVFLVACLLAFVVGGVLEPMCAVLN